MRHILCFLLLLSFFACADNKTSDNTSIDSNKIVSDKLISSPKADGLYLKYKLKEGDKFDYQIKTVSSSTQELISDSTITTNVNQTVQYRINLSVDQIDVNNLATVTVFVESVILDGIINGQPILYDSKYIQSSQERVMFAQYESIKNKSFSINVTVNGEITKIYNMDSIINELLLIQNQKNNATKEQKIELENNFVQSALRPLSEQLFRKFPTEEVTLNYSWIEKYYSQFALFQIENIATYQVDEVTNSEQDSLVLISAGLSINWVGEHNANEQGMTFYFYDPVVSGKGTVKFNKTSGLVTNSNTTTNMEMVTDITGVDEKKAPFKAKRIDKTSNTNIVKFVK
ncbi:MAG: hypothetical protein COW71_01455 [Ignavibacteriales bacterium CG18_big_fil_WC_8_21_14_2_50_31_20]|nr:MAG: hypothetical protein COW71_01455 [Ignavibacteriales bacterium CG18_big_fil_WC_8_21_14_2_50_31_20]